MVRVFPDLDKQHFQHMQTAYARPHCSFLESQNSVQIVFGPLEYSIKEILELDGACAARCWCIGMVDVCEMEKFVVDDPEPIQRNTVV